MSCCTVFLLYFDQIVSLRPQEIVPTCENSSFCTILYSLRQNKKQMGIKKRHGLWEQSYLLSHVGVFLLLFGLQHSPPISQDFGGPPVVKTWVFLAHQGAVAFAKEQEGIHRPACPLLAGVLLNFLRCASTLHL